MEMRSYFEAIYSPAVHYPKNYDSSYMVETVENFVDNGRVLKRTATALKCVAEELSQYNPNDFKLENLEAVGALGSLKSVKLRPSTLEAMDAVSEGAEYFSDLASLELENNNNNDENK